MKKLPSQSPLYHAQHSGRYERQALIRQYEESHEARLMVVVDIIGSSSITYLEELLFDYSDSEGDLHLMLDTPGGDGEIAVRMARSMQARCENLTVIVPDRAKSAGTLLAMGAHKILMGPTSDLGPVDPQLQIPDTHYWVAAKDLLAAVDSALEQVHNQPHSYPLLASLLGDVNFLMYQQAQSAIEHADDLIKSAILSSHPDYEEKELEMLVEKLSNSFITAPKVHGAMFGVKEAAAAGLPVSLPSSKEQWETIWRLWTKYFHRCQQRNGLTRIYENRTASQVVTVPWT